MFNPLERLGGIRLAREPGASVCQKHHVIVHREQALSYGRNTIYVGARLARDAGASVCQALRAIVHREQARLLQGTRSGLSHGIIQGFFQMRFVAQIENALPS